MMSSFSLWCFTCFISLLLFHFSVHFFALSCSIHYYSLPPCPPISVSYLLSLREKFLTEIQSPRYARLRDWHHDRSARALNIKSSATS